jgi:hypothetical protein
MGKALTLDDSTFSAPTEPPRAAKIAAQLIVSEPPATTPKVSKVPLQILVAPEDAKAIKRAALDGDMTYSDFMVSCFHKAMKA